MMKKIFLIICLTISFSNASLKNFADGVVSVKESGGTLNTNDRTVLFGGGYTMKVPNIKLTPFAVKAPSIKAGCGGIDMVFGSLGFLDKEQFVKFAEGIMAAAPGVAFDLALKTLCPSCSETLKALQSMANQINNMSLDSCQAATALGSSALEAIVGNNTKDDLSNNSANNFFKGMNENYLKSGTDFLQKSNNWLAGVGNNDPLRRPKLIMFLSQTNVSSGNNYLLKYMFNNISYINGLDYNILRALTGDIKIISIANSDNPTVINFLPPLETGSRAYFTTAMRDKNDIRTFNTNVENILKRLIGETDNFPTIYNDSDEIESSTNSTFPKGTLHNEYFNKVKSIVSKIINRTSLTTQELEFLGRFDFPVYKIFNTLGNNDFTLSVLDDSSKELSTMLSAQILYELLIKASFEIQKRVSELDTYASQTTKLPITNKGDLREYLKEMSEATRQSAGVCFKIYNDSYRTFLSKLNRNESIKKAKELKQLVMVRTQPDLLNNLMFLETINK
ncbi:MAG: conjugal transfer protein TraH [Aliarcobacter sp.]|nr:conjugal transfer protein TraH [Aliarcobacter sp.]